MRLGFSAGGGAPLGLSETCVAASALRLVQWKSNYTKQTSRDPFVENMETFQPNWIDKDT